MPADFIWKLYGDSEIRGPMSEAEALAAIAEEAKSANDLEFSIRRDVQNFRGIACDVTADFLDALEATEIETETERFQNGETLESNLEAHLEVADARFIGWRIWRKSKQRAAE